MADNCYNIGMTTDHKIDLLLWNEYDAFKVIPGKRQVKSAAEFARYLEVSPPDLNRWMKGDNISLAGCIKLAKKLGDKVYPAAGYEKPTSEDWIESRSLSDLVAIASLIDTWKAEISERGIAIDSPESEAIIRELARKEKS